MTQIFLGIYDFFLRRKPVFWILFVSATLLLCIGAAQIRLEEDITKFFPDDKRVEKLSYVFQNARFVERLVMMVSVRDTSTASAPDSLVDIADELVERMDSSLAPYVMKITSRIDDEKLLGVFELVYEHLPVFLNESDYAAIDSLTRPGNAKKVLEERYRQLISPSGIALKKIIVKDPLGLSFLALRKLRELQYDPNFELYDSYIMTKDHRHIIFFVQPAYPANETGHNSVLIDKLDLMVKEASEKHPQFLASYFGAPAVAVGNAIQLRQDTILTVSMLVVLLAVFLVGFFRKKRVPFLILIPVAFGGLFSLCCIFLLKGSVSILAIAAGSVILGIAVNYALHFLAHMKHVQDVRLVIKDLVGPMTLGSATTVLAFFFLQFANAAVLRDVGLFAGFSLIGAAFCSLVFMPHLIPRDLFKNSMSRENWIEKISISSWESRKWIPWAIILATPVFLYFALQVKFNSDMSRLNFMSPDMEVAQARLEAVNKSSLRAAYVVASAPTLEQALRITERVVPRMQQLKDHHDIDKYSAVSTFLISDSLQRFRIEKWNAFWTTARKDMLRSAVIREGTILKFSDQVLGNFEEQIDRQYQPMNEQAMGDIRAAFFDDYIIEKDSTATVISLMNVDASAKSEVYKTLEQEGVGVFDRQMLTNLFVEYVNADFNFIVTITAILVFVALFISYGRIELTLITFAPMFITWIWILGIMVLAGIEFNIVNVMVSTFIFGLGDDYSIFIMDGLQQEYGAGKKNLPSIRTSIFLSAITTIAGLGVLILARHPALRSVASISIIGIACVFIMSQTIEPFLFKALITNRTRKGLAPMTWVGILRTSFTYSIFFLGAVTLTLIGLIIRILPFGRRRLKLFFHALLCIVTRALIYIEPNVGKVILDKKPGMFSRPAIIIANHTSFLDILLTIMQHPKLILLTNEWVWNSPIFGGVVRLADYFPVTEGAEKGTSRLSGCVEAGYSIVIFPEGKRSADGKPGRFHKGAFYLAETLQLPVRPLLIHGAADAIPKGSFYLNKGKLTLKFLPAIEIDDLHFGSNYADRTRSISKHFKEAYATLATEIETPEYFSHRLITSYLYKGPVLEWYLRVKIRLEKNYEYFHRQLPARGTILDLGCGYGFLCFMLQFLSEERRIIGVDYDEEKIETASHNYLRTERLQFHHADATTFALEKYDGIVISDVLHYLRPEAQEALLVRCFEALNPGGKLIVRDGNADLKDRHWGTRLTEFFSVKLLGFNKSTNPLNFVSGETLTTLALRHGLKVDIRDDTKFTSNVIFMFERSV